MRLIRQGKLDPSKLFEIAEAGSTEAGSQVRRRAFFLNQAVL